MSNFILAFINLGSLIIISLLLLISYKFKRRGGLKSAPANYNSNVVNSGATPMSIQETLLLVTNVLNDLINQLANEQATVKDNSQ